MVVWKYVIPVNADSAMLGVSHRIPSAARFLACAEQHGDIALWYEVRNPDAAKVVRGFHIYGTGIDGISDHLTYVGTTLHSGGALVLHVYEEPR